MTTAPRPPAGPSEMIFAGLTRAAGLFILTLIAGLVAVLVWEAWPALARAGEYRLFTSTEWVPKPPGGGSPTFGALAFVWGTVVTSVIAMLLAVPLGVASAAYLSEIAPPAVRKVGAFLVELLAAIPSVVYGFWGLFFIAPYLQQLFTWLNPGVNTGGNGVLAAGLILAVMVLPYITAISFDVCQAVPRSQREGALALGATRWQTIYSAVLPYARPGIFAASFLALGRALGETMAVTMLIGNKDTVSLSPFALGDSIASKIANQLNEADEPAFKSALIALALVLLAVTGGFNIAARLLLHRLNRPAKATPVAAPTTEDAPAEPKPAPRPRLPLPSNRAAGVWNRVMLTALAGGFVLTVVPLFLILGQITVRGAKAVQPTLFTERERPNLSEAQFRQYEAWQRFEPGAEYPVNEIGRPVQRGGLGHAMLGSLLIASAATALAVPVGLLAAVYLAEARRSRLAAVVRFVTELLGGVPSIVIGIFVYAVLVVPKYGAADPLGFSGWAGAVALAIMMLPLVVRTAEESMKLVPDPIRSASYALGANRMQTTLRVILPAALPAIVTGVFLAVGRIAGETAPLLLTAYGNRFWPSRLNEPTAFLPKYIYDYSRSPYSDWQDQAWGGALVLLAVVMLLNVGIRLLAGKRVVAASRAD